MTVLDGRAPRSAVRSGRLERFLAFSSEVTAYPVFELRGTGLAEAYLATVTEVVGHRVVDALLDRYDAAVVAAKAAGLRQFPGGHPPNPPRLWRTGSAVTYSATPGSARSPAMW